MLNSFFRQSDIRRAAKKGESLVEVIMAIFVVAMGSAVATSLIISALQSNQFSRDNLIALNLAVEGMEAMRSIRDANWLKFSYDKKNCWNLAPDFTITSCDPAIAPTAKQIAPGAYTVDLNMNKNQYGWTMSSVSGDLDLASGPGDNYKLWYYDVDIAKNSDGIAGADDDKDLLASQSSTGGKKLGESRFYRMVKITYLPACVFSQFSTTPCEEMDITSTVQWKSQDVTHQVVLTSKLTNYQKVKVK